MQKRADAWAVQRRFVWDDSSQGLLWESREDVKEFTPSQVLQGVLQCRGVTEQQKGGRNLSNTQLPRLSSFLLCLSSSSSHLLLLYPFQQPFFYNIFYGSYVDHYMGGSKYGNLEGKICKVSLSFHNASTWSPAPVTNKCTCSCNLARGDSCYNPHSCKESDIYLTQMEQEQKLNWSMGFLLLKTCLFKSFSVLVPLFLPTLTPI